MMTNQGVYASQHPLVAIKLSQLRDKNQPPKVVRELIHDLSCLLAYEATADLSIEKSEILVRVIFINIYMSYGLHSLLLLLELINRFMSRIK